MNSRKQQSDRSCVRKASMDDLCCVLARSNKKQKTKKTFQKYQKKLQKNLIRMTFFYVYLKKHAYSQNMEDTLKYTPIQKYMMHRHLENCVEHLQNYLVGIGLSGGYCNSTDYKEKCTKKQIVDELVVNFKGCMEL